MSHIPLHCLVPVLFSVKYWCFFSCFQVLHSMQPLIVYFPDSSLWLSRAVPKSNRMDFVRKVQEMFDHLSGPIVLICGQNKVETGGSKEKERFVSFKSLSSYMPIVEHTQTYVGNICFPFSIVLSSLGNFFSPLNLKFNRQ